MFPNVSNLWPSNVVINVSHTVIRFDKFSRDQ